MLFVNSNLINILFNHFRSSEDDHQWSDNDDYNGYEGYGALYPRHVNYKFS